MSDRPAALRRYVLALRLAQATSDGERAAAEARAERMQQRWQFTPTEVASVARAIARAEQPTQPAIPPPPPFVAQPAFDTSGPGVRVYVTVDGDMFNPTVQVVFT